MLIKREENEWDDTAWRADINNKVFGDIVIKGFIMD